MMTSTENIIEENGTVEELKNAFIKNAVTAEQLEVFIEQLRAKNRELLARGEEYRRRIREVAQ